MVNECAESPRTKLRLVDGHQRRRKKRKRFMFVVYQVRISISISMTMLCTYYALFVDFMTRMLGLLVLFVHFVCWGLGCVFFYN